MAWICLSATAAAAEPSSVVDPLNQWIGDMYNGLNNMRVTAVTSTPLRLRSALNSFAQSQAISICRTNSPALSNDEVIDALKNSASGSVKTENAQMLVARNQGSVDSVIASWASAALGSTSPRSAIIFPNYVYVGVGVCGNFWVVVLTSEFE
ncbi:hypothetical protein GGI21_000388 [Coemansia aciculifera]|nr:hypothetical protein GGI21_000388 [Coemansia aciculifera]